MKKSIGIIISMALFVSPLSAQTSLAEIPSKGLAQNCNKAIAYGGETKPFADEILRRKKMDFSKYYADMAIACLKDATGNTYQYLGGEIVADAELVERRQRAQQRNLEQAQAQAQADQLQEERKTAYIGAVVQICFKEYRSDRFRALTTPICGEVFKARGLPK